MDNKLALSLNATIIDKAEAYAKSNGISLSSIIVSYLSLLTKVEESEEEVYSPTVMRLVGSVGLPDDFSYKSEYTDYLIKKYK